MKQHRVITRPVSGAASDLARQIVWPAAACVALLTAAPTARAQTAPQGTEAPQFDQYFTPNIYGTGVERGVTVLSRQRPDYESSGVHAGSFTIRPQLTESTGYDSNVTGTAQPHGSTVVQSEAAVSAQSNWTQDLLQAGFGINDVRYPGQPRQSFTNWTASVNGSHAFGRDLLSANYAHLNLNQTVTGLDTAQIARPLPYVVDTGQVGYRVNINRVFVTPSVQVANYTYGNSAVLGTPYTQSYRDRVVVAPGIVGGYELSPQNNVIVVVHDAMANYSNRVAGLARRDFNDVSVLGGLDYSADSAIRYRVLVGYDVRNFSSRQYKTIASPIVEGTVTWTPSGLTTVTGTASRHIQDSADETTAGYTETLLQLRVDHEYLRNVLLRGNAGVYFSDYNHGGGSQTLYTAGGGVTYLLNRNMQLTASYDFSARQSSGQANLGASLGVVTPGSVTALGAINGFGFGSNYTDHLFLLRLSLRL